MSKQAKRSSNKKRANKSAKVEVVKASIDKRFNVSDSVSIRKAMSDLISKVAAKVKAEKRLTDVEAATCLALKFRTVKELSTALFFEQVNSKSKVATHKSSTYVAKFNATCKTTAKRLRDIRNAVYSLTVREYKKDSQFAASVSIFDCCYSVSTAANSSNLTYTLKTLKTAATFVKVAALKSLKSEVATCIKAVS